MYPSVRFLLSAFLLFCTSFFSAPNSRAEQGPEMTVNLSAADAKIMGREPKVVEMDNRDVIVGWRTQNDWIKWNASIPKPGIYNVLLEYAYPGKTGSVVEVAVGNQGVQTQVLWTESDQNFALTFMGKVQIDQAGTVPVNLTVVQKHGSMIMNLRSVRLVRTDETVLSEPAKPAVHPAVP